MRNPITGFIGHSSRNNLFTNNIMKRTMGLNWFEIYKNKMKSTLYILTFIYLDNGRMRNKKFKQLND